MRVGRDKSRSRVRRRRLMGRKRSEKPADCHVEEIYKRLVGEVAEEEMICRTVGSG